MADRVSDERLAEIAGERGRVSTHTQAVAIARELLDARPREAARPDDLRALGWSVAVHNDYRLNGEPHTFWLLTKEGRAIKGEGKTDAEALNAIRAALGPAPAAGAPRDEIDRIREEFHGIDKLRAALAGGEAGAEACEFRPIGRGINVKPAGDGYDFETEVVSFYVRPPEGSRIAKQLFNGPIAEMVVSFRTRAAAPASATPPKETP